jgi:hypothetical protein
VWSAELSALAQDVRQRFLRIAKLIELHGVVAMREPHVKHLEGELWEMRMKGRDGTSPLSRNDPGLLARNAPALVLERVVAG